MIMTVGHGALPQATFIQLLDGHRITTLADVRSKPGSRWHPHFNKAALSNALAATGIKYVHLPSLGGLHDGAGKGDGFEQGITDLIALASMGRTAIMCGCRKHTNCHRETMIGARLRQRGVEVVHIDHEHQKWHQERLFSNDSDM